MLDLNINIHLASLSTKGTVRAITKLFETTAL
jgi:hypothetical protein